MWLLPSRARSHTRSLRHALVPTRARPNTHPKHINRPPQVRELFAHIPLLLRSDLLVQLVTKPPEGAGALLRDLLTDASELKDTDSTLVSRILSLHRSGRIELAWVTPILSKLSAEQATQMLPAILKQPQKEVAASLMKLVHAQPPPIPPAQLLLLLHLLQHEAAGVSLKQVIDAVTLCLAERSIFTESVLSELMLHLVEEKDLPLLCMRTIIQARCMSCTSNMSHVKGVNCMSRVSHQRMRPILRARVWLRVWPAEAHAIERLCSSTHTSSVARTRACARRRSCIAQS